MTRRDFVVGGAAAVGTTVFGVESARKPRLAFHVYAVRDLCEGDLVETLKKARSIGYEGVETGRFYGRGAAEWNSICKDIGLELIALQLYPHMLTEPQIGQTIRFCHESGCLRINAAWFKGSRENSNDWKLVVNVINHAAEVCAKEGIEIGYHNHDQEFLTFFDGKTALSWLYERFDSRVKQEFDPGWCVLAGQDPCTWLKTHPCRNPTMHVMPAISETDVIRTRPGVAGIGSRYDQVDWRNFLPSARNDGVEWFVVKPTAHPDSLDDLVASYGYLADSMH